MEEWFNIRNINVIHHINRIISIDKGKTLNKNLQPFRIKILTKVEKDGNFLNVIKSIYQNPVTNIIMVKRLKTFALKQDNDTHFYHCFSTTYWKV